MNGSELSKVNYEKDLGLTISSYLKPGKHCLDVVKKAYNLVGFIEFFFIINLKKSYPYTI